MRRNLKVVNVIEVPCEPEEEREKRGSCRRQGTWEWLERQNTSLTLIREKERKKQNLKPACDLRLYHSKMSLPPPHHLMIY